MSDTTYILGHDPEELRRLELQAKALEPLTIRLLDDIGLSEGMSVLDIGTGAGDVALLAAGRVGPSGRVLGIDRNADALNHARARAERAGFDWVTFDEVAFPPGNTLTSYDLVIGRFVLMHQSDPVAFLRHAASHVRDGGVVAFYEMAEHAGDHRYSMPPVAPFDEAMGALLTAFERAHADLDIGSRLTGIFLQSGLSAPLLISEIPVGGASSMLPEWLARTASAVGVTSSWTGLAEAIRTDAIASNSQMFGPRSVAAWVHRRRGR